MAYQLSLFAYSQLQEIFDINSINVLISFRYNVVISFMAAYTTQDLVNSTQLNESNKNSVTLRRTSTSRYILR